MKGAGGISQVEEGKGRRPWGGRSTLGAGYMPAQAALTDAGNKRILRFKAGITVSSDLHSRFGGGAPFVCSNMSMSAVLVCAWHRAPRLEGNASCCNLRMDWQPEGGLSRIGAFSQVFTSARKLPESCTPFKPLPAVRVFADGMTYLALHISTSWSAPTVCWP